ncbi:hypothetical protein J6590_074578 [Homalodisca vitripennis]|nr:hypothetical protein J6590_074578 [Homalodisca vitripennis]
MEASIFYSKERHKSDNRRAPLARRHLGSSLQLSTLTCCRCKKNVQTSLGHVLLTVY